MDHLTAECGVTTGPRQSSQNPNCPSPGGGKPGCIVPIPFSVVLSPGPGVKSIDIDPFNVGTPRYMTFSRETVAANAGAVRVRDLEVNKTSIKAKTDGLSNNNGEQDEDLSSYDFESTRSGTNPFPKTAPQISSDKPLTIVLDAAAGGERMTGHVWIELG